MPWSKKLQESYKMQSDIKYSLKDCPVCESPVSQKDLDDYKMCSWCYSQQNLENEGGPIYTQKN